MLLNLLICSTSCALVHIMLWPWNRQTGLLSDDTNLEDMFLLVRGTQTTPRDHARTSPKKNLQKCIRHKHYIFSLTCFTPQIWSCQAMGCANAETPPATQHQKRALCSPQLQSCQGSSTSTSGVSFRVSAVTHCKQRKFSFWIH